MVMAAAVLANSALHTSVYASNVARGKANLADARANRATLDRLAGAAQVLERQVAGHAAANASAFLFLPQQAWPQEQARAFLENLSAEPAAPSAGPGAEGLAQEARDYAARLGQL